MPSKTHEVTMSLADKSLGIVNKGSNLGPAITDHVQHSLPHGPLGITHAEIIRLKPTLSLILT
jgi:hypothetical protein